MPNAFEFCLPTSATSVPDRPNWLHEVKYDGYRLRLEREGNRVRLITRGGYNWADRYSWIVEVALKNRHQQFVIDGEAVILGASTASPISTPCTRAGTTRRCSSTPSISWRSTARISGSCRYASRSWRVCSSV